MGVITTEHLDDSELTDEELAYWTVHVRESLGNDYLKRLRELQAAGCYPRDDAGWERLKAHAWQDTLDHNEICKTISAISAQRRAERAREAGWVEATACPDDATTEPLGEPMPISMLMPDPAPLQALRAQAIATQR